MDFRSIIYTTTRQYLYTLYYSLILCTHVSGHGHGFINKHSQTIPILGFRAKHIAMNKALRTTSEGLKKTKTSRLHHALAVSCIIHTTSTSVVISLRELTTATLLVFIPLLEKYLTPDRPRNDDTSFAI